MKKATTINMGKFQEWVLGSILVVSIALLSACGGGGSGGGTPAGTTTSGVSSGEIEGFGSIIVNGVKFEVEGAEVETEHGITTVASNETTILHEGMHVEVEVEFNDNGTTGTAARVIVDDELKGMVNGAPTADAAGNIRFTVLGQAVVATPGVTHVDDSNYADGELPLTTVTFSDGDFVEVHGLPDGNGNLIATYIEFLTNNQTTFENENEYQVTGTIDTGTLTATNFAINGQDINHATAAKDGTLAEGLLVEVKGTWSGPTVTATSIHIEDGFGNNLAKVEAEGLVRELTATTFTLKGQLVNYSNATFYGGVEADLANGLRVEAEGPIVNGTLQATKIKYKDNFRYDGAATKQANGSWSISNPGGATDLVVWLDDMTDDDALANADATSTTRDIRFRARQLQGPELLAIRTQDGSGGGGGTRQEFEAIVIVKGDPVVQILDDGTGTTGLLAFDTTPTADLQGATDFKIEDVSTSRAAFMAALNVGDRVKVRYDNGVEDEIQIELDD